MAPSRGLGLPAWLVERRPGVSHDFDPVQGGVEGAWEGDSEVVIEAVRAAEGGPRQQSNAEPVRVLSEGRRPRHR